MYINFSCALCWNVPCGTTVNTIRSPLSFTHLSLPPPFTNLTTLVSISACSLSTSLLSHSLFLLFPKGDSLSFTTSIPLPHPHPFNTRDGTPFSIPRQHHSLFSHLVTAARFTVTGCPHIVIPLLYHYRRLTRAEHSKDKSVTSGVDTCCIGATIFCGRYRLELLLLRYHNVMILF